MAAGIRSVMLVDDSEADNYFHRLIIEESGLAHEVEDCLDAPEALKRIEAALRGERSMPDLILLDINMPVMDGWQFLQRYMKLVPSERYSTVVVMLSTSLNPADRERADALDVVRGYCTKPLDEASLQQLVDKYFG